MSIKIYTAYRLKDSGEFWPILRDCRRRGLEAVRELVCRLATTIVPMDKSSADYGAPDRAREIIGLRELGKRYQAQATSGLRDEYDFDVTITVREYRGALYLVPYCDMFLRDALHFLRSDPRLEDFAYWDNADELEGISEMEWQERRAVWLGIDEAGWLDTAVIEICTPQKFWTIFT